MDVLFATVDVLMIPMDMIPMDILIAMFLFQPYGGAYCNNMDVLIATAGVLVLQPWMGALISTMDALIATIGVLKLPP